MEKQEKNNVVKEVEKATKQVSKSYSVRQFGENIKKLETSKLINENEKKELEEIQKKIAMRFLGIELF